MNFTARLPSATGKKQWIARAIACGMMLVLPACHIPDLRQPESGPELPAGFHGTINKEADAESLESSAKFTVQEFYSDPMLTQLIQQATVNNRELKILDQEVEIASNEIMARRGMYLPFVSVGAGAGLEKPSLYTPMGAAENQLLTPNGNHFPDPMGSFYGSINFLWHLDIWKELRNSQSAAEQNYFATIERRNNFVTHLVAEIAENYYRLMSLDKRLETLNKTIELQQQSLEMAKVKKEAVRGTELGVQRFQAEVRKNQSELLIVKQEIVEVESHINLLANRFPSPIERDSAGFLDLNIHALSMGVPAQLLQNRPDIRQAERELLAAGLDVKVARAHFFPRLDLSAGVGYQAFNPRYLFVAPEALAYNLAGELVAPLINKNAIKAEYLSANAKQLESVYNYQRVILNAFTEVITRMSKVENYGKSIEIKKQQLASLEASVETANKLFQNARAEYVEVLLAQRDLLEARTVLIETKKEQLSAIVNTYQALGGGGSLLTIANCKSTESHP